MLFFATYQHIFSSAWTVEPLTGSLRLPISTLTKAIATEQLSARCHSSTTYKKAIDFPIHLPSLSMVFGFPSAIQLPLGADWRVFKELSWLGVLLSRRWCPVPPSARLTGSVPLQKSNGWLAVQVQRATRGVRAVIERGDFYGSVSRFHRYDILCSCASATLP